MGNKIIFICTGNSCRSQIAEGLFRETADDKFEVFSAGSNPSRLHPAAIKVMAEWGIDIQKQESGQRRRQDNQRPDHKHAD